MRYDYGKEKEEEKMWEVVVIDTDRPRFMRADVLKDKDYIYLFSDNAKRTSITSGTGIPLTGSWYEDKYGKYIFPRKTQARIRGIHNAYPITTLYDEHHSQWSDKKFDEYKVIIDDDIEQLLDVLKSEKYKGIKVLNYAFGNEHVSRMKYVAPKCYEYLNKKLEEVGVSNDILGNNRSKNIPKFEISGKNHIKSRNSIWYDSLLQKETEAVR